MIALGYLGFFLGASAPARPRLPAWGSLPSPRPGSNLLEVASVEAFDDPWDAPLFLEEQPVIAGSVETRRREFTTAWTCALCAGEARDAAGADTAWVKGAPQWPAGITGAITHCAGYRAAAVARQTTVLASGIDAEPRDLSTRPGFR